jgi:hypothetical protein
MPTVPGYGLGRWEPLNIRCYRPAPDDRKGQCAARRRRRQCAMASNLCGFPPPRQSYRVIDTAAENGQPINALRRTERPFAFVLGNEERGLPRATLEACDEVVCPERGDPSLLWQSGLTQAPWGWEAGRTLSESRACWTVRFALGERRGVRPSRDDPTMHAPTGCPP